MNDHSQKIETLRKRLMWRASHRGIKEMDIIVGGFAAARIPSMDEETLNAFADVLELPDQDLLSWLTKQETVPLHLRSQLLFDLMAFHPDFSA